MQKIDFHYSITPIQKLFVEKGLELLYKNTIDTYRLRLHNPKTIIEELISVCQLSKEGHLTSTYHCEAVAKEATYCLKNGDNGMEFLDISREYFLHIINNIKKENFNRIIQASKLVLNRNIDYKDQLLAKIEGILINSESEFYNDSVMKKNLFELIQYLLVEFVSIGYTKPYLYNFFRTIFVHSISKITFEERYSIWKSLSTRNKENYYVLFNILGDSFQYKELSKIDSEYEHVNGKFKSKLPRNTSKNVRAFMEARKNGNLFSRKVKAYDHFKAIEIAHSKLSSDLDLYHLCFNKIEFKLDSQAAVIGENHPEKASTLPSNFQIDGYFRSSRIVFDELLDKVKMLRKNKVSEESIDKVISSIRYLRTGSESPELESKLLNYWIGLEYIFTSSRDGENTITRMKKYFSVCHGLIYIKRNLYDFHKAIDRLGISEKITGYNHDLCYLSTSQSYHEIIENSTNELLNFRAAYYLKWNENPGEINKALQKHEENLQWNLNRLYRLRNEIVHNAAVKNSIYVNVSHIKYYLTFILNSILDFMANRPIDADNDGEITIEDYFITQDIIYGSLKGKTLDEHLKVSNPIEILN